MTNRIADENRTTNETVVSVSVDLDGKGVADIATGIGFLDHMLAQLAHHSRVDIRLRCDGDRVIDDHHTAEDCALALGAVVDRALGDRRGVHRFGSAYAPLDEALARAVVDLSGRPHATIDLGIHREQLGELAGENVAHVLRSFAIAARATLHVDVLRGENDHHRAEAAFKATALALRDAVARSSTRESESADIPSTKGTLR